MKTKLIAKILAFAGVMVMLFALAIPCFASDEASAYVTAENVTDTTFYMPYSEYIHCYNFGYDEKSFGGELTDNGLLKVDPFDGADYYHIESTRGNQFYYYNDLIVYCEDYITVNFSGTDENGVYHTISLMFYSGEKISFSDKPMICEHIVIYNQGGWDFDEAIYIDWANNPIHAKEKSANEINQLNTTIVELNERIEILSPSHGGIYFSIYNIIDNHVFGGESVAGNTYDLVTTLLSVLACVLMVCLPFLVVFLFIKAIRG